MFQKILTSNPIKSARIRMNLTGDQLAEEMNKITGSHLTKAEISRWESSKHKPNKDTIFLLARVLNQDPYKFYRSVVDHYDSWRPLFREGKLCRG